MVITNPSPLFTFRFVYPYLAVASLIPSMVYIWDLPTVSIVQTLPLGMFEDGNLPFHPRHHAHILEIHSDRVFLCDSHGLRVYSLSSGKIDLDLPRVSSSGQTFYPLLTISLSRPYQVGLGLHSLAQHKQNPSPHIESLRLVPVDPHYISYLSLNTSRFGLTLVRVSPSGKDLVAATLSGMIFYIPDFADSRGLEDRIRVVDIKASVVQIEFDGKRIVVCSVSLNLLKSIRSTNDLLLT